MTDQAEDDVPQPRTWDRVTQQLLAGLYAQIQEKYGGQAFIPVFGPVQVETRYEGDRILLAATIVPLGFWDVATGNLYWGPNPQECVPPPKGLRFLRD